MDDVAHLTRFLKGNGEVELKYFYCALQRNQTETVWEVGPFLVEATCPIGEFFPSLVVCIEGQSKDYLLTVNKQTGGSDEVQIVEEMGNDEKVTLAGGGKENRCNC